MADFLSSMVTASHARLTGAMQEVPGDEMRRRALARREARRLELHPSGFDVIAEIKRHTPSEGVLSDASGGAAQRMVATQGSAYAQGGATAISVLTEPTRFAGALDDVITAARSTEIPVMRKDFLVDPYQVYEARAYDASGVLLIARLLEPQLIPSFVSAAEDTCQFILLEIFGVEELRTVERVVDAVTNRNVTLLIGVNARNLETLAVDTERFAALAPHLPTEYPLVAESGIHSVADIHSAAGLGYRLALVGTALMKSVSPAQTLTQFVDAGRRAAKACASE